MQTLGLLLVGVAVGVAAAFSGLGGGIVIVPLLLVLGHSPSRAVGTSFLAIVILALSALVAHGRLDNVDWKLGLLLGAGGVVGAQIGARVVERVPTELFTKIFAGLLVALAIYLLARR